VRMSALIPTGAIHVYTHDSIGLGEDGPTHQPVEHVASLRLIPNLEVWRPADKVETAVAWRQAIVRRDGPTALVLTRQGVAHQARSAEQVEAIGRGGYILRDCDAEPAAILIATGSEVGLAVAAAESLESRGVGVRVVSMPNPGRFLAQDDAYRASVLPASVAARLAIEAGVPDGWHRFVGPGGDIVGLSRFGASAPAPALFDELGFNVATVVERTLRLLGDRPG